MRKIYLIFVISGLLFLTSSFRAEAAVPATGSAMTNVQASVGKYYFSITGLASPFASIVMSSSGFFQASTVADPRGYFSISDVFVNEGFSDFCLETIDLKRVGDSLTCIEIKPLMADARKDNILLPPTLGLSGKKIGVGSSVFASGYSMPNANIKVSVSKDIILDAVTDSKGFYKLEIKDLPVGKYLLIASAKYQKIDSEKSIRGKELESLSLSKLILQNLPKILLIVLLVLLVIILLIILISKKARKRIRDYLLDKGIIAKKEEKRKLHHEWFIGF